METLLDPCNDRICNEIPLPPNKPLLDSIMFPNKSKLASSDTICPQIIQNLI